MLTGEEWLAMRRKEIIQIINSCNNANIYNYTNPVIMVKTKIGVAFRVVQFLVN